MPTILETPDLILDAEDERVPFEGVPIGGGMREVGSARTYRVLGLDPREVELLVYDITWVDGAREILAPEREAGNHPRFDGIVGRHRLGVQRSAEVSYIVLGQARLNGTPRTSFRWPDLIEMDRGAGVPLADTLGRFGAIRFGTRADVLGDTGRHRNRAAASFEPASALHLPAVAFVLTRVAPVARGMTG